MLHLHIFFKTQAPSAHRRIAFSMLPVRIGVGRIDSLIAVVSIFLRSEISDAMYNLLLCIFC